MSLSTYPDVPTTTVATLNTVPTVVPDVCQENRIKAAVGLPMDRIVPKVNRKILSRYYEFLSANLQFPFVAHYPEPTNAPEDREFRCVVSGLLAPETLGDEFDGLFCKVRKENCKLNVPLIELVIPQTGRNFQLVEDYSVISSSLVSFPAVVSTRFLNRHPGGCTTCP